MGKDHDDARADADAMQAFDLKGGLTHHGVEGQECND